MAERKIFNPFPGLRPFGAEEDFLFFGREEQTRELLQLLRAHRFLAVVGTSGSGKSSLVRAGLLPALFGGTMVGAGSDWSTVVFRPGGDPLLNLAEAMIGADLYDREDDESPLRIRATLSRSRLGLVQTIKQSELPEGTNLLIVVDQFEELFRFRDTSSEHQSGATAFVKLLLNAVADPDLPIYVAITMRSDYLGDCAQLPGLAEAVNDGEYLIPKLTRDQKRAAIEKPVAVGGGQVSPALVQQLLNDVGDDSDQLPILQHVLMRIWDKWESDHDETEPIDLRHYDSVGGMEHALSRHADEVYEELPDDNSRQLAMRLFQAITERSDDERGTRRPTRLDQLCSIVDGSQDDVAVVLDAYRQSGRTFVMPSPDVTLQPETVVDISHESLMRAWERLRGWVAEESQAVRIYRRLAETAALHEDEEAGVYRDPDLQIATSWRDNADPNQAWAYRYHDGFDVAMAFLDMSWTTAHAEEEAREAARQRELEQAKRLADSERKRAEVQARAKKRLYVLLAGISAALMVAVGMYIYAEDQRELAESNRKQAVANAETATENEQLANKNADEAERNADEARRQETVARKNADEATRQAKLAEVARAEARKGLYRSQMLIAHRGLVQEEGLEQISKILDNWRPKSGDKDLRGWEWHYLNSLRSSDQQFISTGSTFQAAADWSPVGSLVAFGTADGSIVLSDVKTGQEVKRFVGHGGRILGLQFSRDGKLLASGSRDNTVRVWDVDLGLERQVFNGHNRWVHTVDFSPDKSRIVSSSFDGTARIWEVKTGKLLNNFQAAFNSWAVSLWSPSGDFVATVANDHEIVIRNVTDFAVVKTLKTHSAQIRTLDWSHDSKRLATGAEDGEIEILDVTTGASISRLTGHSARLLSLRWSPDDRRLISGGVDGFARIWDVQQATLDSSLVFQVFVIVDVAWSPDGKELLVNGNNGRLWIHRPEQADESESLSRHTGMARSVAWHPAQKMIAYGGDDRLVHIVSLENSKDSTTLKGHSGKINAVCWSPDGKWLATGAADASVRIWAADTLKTIAVLDELEENVQALAWSPDGKQLAMGLGNPNAWPFSNRPVVTPRDIVILDMADPSQPNVKHSLSAHRSVLALAWNSTSDRLASAGVNAKSDNERIRIWDTVNGTETRQLTLPFERVYSLQWTPDNKTIIAGSSTSLQQGSIKFVSIEDGSILKTLEGQDTVFSVALNRDGTRLLAAGKDRTVKLWDIESEAEMLTISTSSTAVLSAAWSPDYTQIAAVGAELAIYDAYESFLAEHSPTLLEALNAREANSGLNAVELRARADLHSLQNNWDEAVADLQELNKVSGQPRKWFLMPWRIQGPFPGGLKSQTRLDQNPDPFAADPPELGSPLSDWLPIRLTADGMLDMAAFTGFAEQCSCYAISRIYSVKDQQAAFLMGTDDSHRIWMNGELVDEFIGNRPAQPDQDVFTAQLKQGWNTILFRVHNGFGDHGLYFRITDEPLQIALALNRKGQFQAAVSAWDKLIADQPNEQSFLAFRLQASLGAALYERASEDLATLGKLVPENNELQIKRIDVALARGEFGEAIESLTMAIDRTGGSPESLIRRAELHRLVGNSEQAKLDLARSIAINTTVGGGRSRTSGSRMINRVANAIDRVELVKAGRNSSVPWRYTFEVPSGAWTETGFDDTEWNPGLSPFGSEGTNKKTTWGSQHEQIWLRHEFQIERVAEGKLRINAFIDEDAVFYLNGVRIAEGRWKGFGYQNLRPAINGALPLKRGKNVLAVMCRNTFRNGGIDVALSVENPNSDAIVDILNSAQAAAPRDGVIGILRGKQLLLNQRWSEASEAYLKGIDSAADDHWSWYESIGIEWLLGNTANMQGQVDKMIERFRDDPDATIVRRVVNRAVYSDFVQFDPAAIDKMVEQFVTAAPNHPFTPLIHGVVLFRKGDYSAAEEQFARAKELGQNGSWVFHGFRETFQARIAFRQGNFDEALLKFQRISRSFGMRGPKSHKDKLNDSWIDQMAVMILMAEAGKEMSKVFAGKDLTLQQRRLGILSLQAVARRHRFARQHEKFLEATRQALAQLISLVGDRDIASDRQAVMFLVWQQLNADPEFQLPRDEVHAALETLFPASSLALPRVEWSTLKPLDFQSREEVESTIEPDHSIFVGGAHPRQNVYTVRYEVPSGHITGLRLELVRDSRLSSFGPGRNGNGNTHIHNVEFNVHSGGNSASPALKVAGATSAFHSWDGASSRQNRASGMFDDDESTYFDVWPKTGRNHNIVAELAGPVVSADGDQLGVTIECTSERFGFHTVGRFRISATTSTAGLRIQRCWGDVSPQSVSYWSIMAARLMNANQFDKAKPWVERALSDDDPSTAFDWLVAARYYRHAGDQAQADQLHSDAALWASSYRRERSILERLLTSVAPPQSTTKVPGQ